MVGEGEKKRPSGVRDAVDFDKAIMRSIDIPPDPIAVANANMEKNVKATLVACGIVASVWYLGTHPNALLHFAFLTDAQPGPGNFPVICAK
eukprot:g52172.t1